ncbi:MAG: SusC/RagA family TonB-linked outer membrane protein [Balneolales bacterium]
MQEKYSEPGLDFQIPRGYQGLVGRVTYDYRLRYLAEVNMGYNGSENFPDGNRYGFFPALSLGWVITEEPFFPANNFLTFFKIRGSYGEVGNDRIGGNRFLYLPSVFNPSAGGYYFGDYGSGQYQHYSGAQEGNIGNPLVTWERAQKSNIGLESGFFSDMLSINLDYFIENRNNILTNLGTVPDLVQASLPAVNIGEVENKGYEVEVQFRNNLGRLNYWINGSYSKAKNEIKFQDEPTRAHEWLQRTGHPVGQHWGLVSDGFYNTEEDLAGAPSSQYASELQLGDIKYLDQNDDGVIDENDQVPIGYSQLPQIIYGVSVGGNYRGFDFSILFQGAEKSSTNIDQMGAWAFDTDWRNATTRHLERWTPERYAAGEPITYPRVELSPTPGKHNYVSSDFWLEDTSYLRVKNVEVAYSFRSGVLETIGIRNLRIYANGNNLFTWSNMNSPFDPEAPGGRGEFYPQMRVYNMGINIQF